MATGFEVQVLAIEATGRETRTSIVPHRLSDGPKANRVGARKTAARYQPAAARGTVGVGTGSGIGRTG